MSDWAPLTLPRLDADAARLMNDLVGVGRDLPIPVGGKTAALRFTAHADGVAGLAAAVQAGGRAVWVHFADWNALPPIGALLDGQPLDRLPAPILVAVLNAALQPQLDQLSELLGRPCSIDRTQSAADLPADLLRLGFELDLPAGTVTGLLAGDPPALELVRDLTARVAPAPRQSVDHLPLIAACEIGMTQLPLEDFQSLRRFDVVLLDVVAPRDKPAGLLRFTPELAWRATLGEKEVTLVEQVKLKSWGRHAENQATVVLTFEQGRVELPAGQLAALQPGAALPWSEPDQITIRTGPQLLGRGQLVAIGDRTGVRLTEW